MVSSEILSLAEVKHGLLNGRHILDMLVLHACAARRIASSRPDPALVIATAMPARLTSPLPMLFRGASQLRFEIDDLERTFRATQASAAAPDLHSGSHGRR